MKILLVPTLLAGAFLGPRASQVLVAPARTGHVLVVNDQAGPGVDYTTIQEAVDAAADGTTILVNSGYYRGFVIDDKSVNVVVEAGATLEVAGARMEVRNLGPGKSVVLRGIKPPPNVPYPQSSSLRLSNNAGSVWVEDCVLQAGGIYQLDIGKCADVTIVRCVVLGFTEFDHYHGASISESTVRVFDSMILGSGGFYYVTLGSDGGDGLRVSRGSRVFLYGVSVFGGDGIMRYLGYPAGDGGTGIIIEDGSSVVALDSDFKGGKGGVPTGIDGESVVLLDGGTLKETSKRAHTTRSEATTVRAGMAFDLSLGGVRGEEPWVLLSTTSGFHVFPGIGGAFLLGLPLAATAIPVAPLPRSGETTLSLDAPPLRPDAGARAFYAQAVFRERRSGDLAFGSATAVTVVDPSVQPVFDDCNDNGQDDFLDVLHHAVPDCNRNDLPDSCDIESGTSYDCDRNGIPDECEDDCNDNGLEDSCDIAFGTSQDVNGNGVPDECLEEGDCNRNGISDLVDIASGLSTDCDGNFLPDECDPDCDLDGIPDACDVPGNDCDGDLVPDVCDVVIGRPLVTAMTVGLTAIRDDWALASTNHGLAQGRRIEVYKRDSDGFWRLDQLLPLDDAPGSKSLPIDGQTLVVGDSTDFLSDIGEAFVYTLGADGLWTLTQTLLPDRPHDGSIHFGRDVDVDGIDMVVLSEEENGAIYVYERDASGWWNRVDKLRGPSGGTLTDYVSLSGGVILAAESLSDGSYAVFTVERGPGGWTEYTTIARSAAIVEYHDIDGDVLAFGTLDRTLHVYERSAGGSWVQTATFVGSFELGTNTYPGNVQVSGDRVTASSFTVGKGFVFRRGLDEAWELEATVHTRSSMSIDGSFVVTVIDVPGAHRAMIATVDCNDNGVPDKCDLISGTSSDWNFNGVPDECD